MAMMEGVPEAIQDNVFPSKIGGEQTTDAMNIDVQPEAETNGQNGEIRVSPTAIEPPVESEVGGADGDIMMGNIDPPQNGLLDATELVSSAPALHETNSAAPQNTESNINQSADEVLLAPEHVEQPVSEVRDEVVASITVVADADSMVIDKPTETSATQEQTSDPAPLISAQVEEVTGSDEIPMTSSAVEEDSFGPTVEVVLQPSQTTAEIDAIDPSAPQEDMGTQQALGQVRQRDEDDEIEPTAKRAKISPEVESTKLEGDVVDSTEPVTELATGPVTTDETETTVEAAADSASVGDITAASSSMAAPGLPGSGPSEFSRNPLTKSQTRYLLDSVRKAKKIKAAIPFLNAVDPVSMNIPTYPTIVPNPMDLGTIEDKLKNEKYASANALWGDFELMASNALAFNGANHPVTHSGLNLRAYFNKLMQSIPKGDAAAADPVKKAAESPKPVLPRRESRHIPVTKASPTPVQKPTPKPAAKPKVEIKKHEPVLDSNGVPVIRRASESERPKREIIKPQSKDMPYSTTKPKKKAAQLELKFCEQVVLKEIKKPKNQTFAYPFMLPVDPVALNIPTYHTVVKNPMDFGTIERKLQKDEYNNAKEFAKDARQVFKNCFTFNGPNEPVHLFGRQLAALFEELWEQKDEWIAANQPASEPVSEEESEPESSEDEPESQEERMRKVVELQKQIAALTAQVIELTNAPLPKQKKKKSKSKSEGSKKQKRPSVGTAAPSSKPSKAKKAAKPRKLTLEQKRYVSEGIMMLDEVNMRKAVQMIRNGVPKLKDVNDDELELDVDEIPDPVLQTLHKFVKDYRRANGTDAAEDDDYEEAEEAPKHTTSSHRKKSKPMSAREQESRIAQVKQQLQQFEGGSGSDQANNNGEDGDSSEDASSSSEEE